MKPLRSLNLSDVHLGCRRLFADWMVANLLTLILPYISEIDMLVIQGDLFDTAVGFADVPAVYIVRFISALLKACDENNVTVRILRGTFSHDRTQNAIIPEIHQYCKLRNDLLYVDNVRLEYIEKYDMRVAYVPDNIPFQSSDDVIAAIREMMSAMGWDTVDYVYLHGSFDHTLPEVAARHCKVLYRQDQFSFVTRYVVVGHIHHHSIVGNIINNGTIDRLCHGEEEPKGMVLIDDRVTDASITFIENTKATRFVTYDISDLGSDEVGLTTEIEERLATLPDDVQKHVRIIHPRADIRSAVVQFLRTKYPLIRFTHDKGATTESVEEVATVEVEDPEDTVVITEETLPDLLHAHAKEKTRPLDRKAISKLLTMVESSEGISR